MGKVPRKVKGFFVLPVKLSNSLSDETVPHCIYLQSHEPRTANEDATRSLFLLNIPISTTTAHLKNLFSSQLGAGRIANVDFSEDVGRALVTTTKIVKKRKRQTVDELEAALDFYHLPATFPTEIRPSGHTAIVTFVDQTSRDASLEAARQAAKRRTELIWEAGDEKPSQSTGLARYTAHKTLQYPDRAVLLQIADNYMTAFSELENARAAENAKRRAAPDEDGFVTVTRGAKGAIVRSEEADLLRAKQSAKEKGLEDFYRFQMREKRKEQAGEFLKKFEQDKRKIEEMKKRRGALGPRG